MDLTGAEWRKSSYSGNTGDCVEVARNLPGVVEVARNLPGVVAVRDSKDPDGPVLVFAADEWRAFVSGARAGEFGG